MSYLSLLIALFMMSKAPAALTSNGWTDRYLDNLVGVETFFLTISWWIFGIVLAAAIVFVIVSFLKHSEGLFGFGMFSGCVALTLLTLPLWEYLTLFLAKNMASAFDPVLGITNTSEFYINLLIFILIGIG